MYNRFILLAITCCIYSCAPTRFVKPLDKNQHAANVSLGGPLFKYGNATIPIPFLTATYGYGIDSTITGFAALNITSALYGNLQIELGASKQFLKQNNYFPAVSITPVANVIYRDKNAYKFYPQLDINAFWEYGKRKNLIYVGIDNWFELSKKKAYELKQTNHWMFSPMVGHSFNGKKWNFNIETKIIAPNLSNEKLTVDYQTPFNKHGALGIYLGYTRKFN